MTKYALFAIALVFSISAIAQDPKVGQLKKGQRIVAVRDIVIPAGETTWKAAKSPCKFSFEGAVIDRIIPRGTALVVESAKNWTQAIERGWEYCGIFLCYQSFRRTTVTFAAPTGFDRFALQCARASASYLKTKMAFERDFSFP